ncbi:hypothetical protein LIX60_03785 [Streptomyces sp. S07_1.15]|uniref:hypothetical protein n=1 Tax=Streptomyces sp. S07_1.15 TaxID=2873925 RepID=UPI001D14F0F6|nr:hypothetical protein [Streptomyces sp. S07_1.15]MCC3650627.1 hypothetical protein [Streptomyces sp. S07_1.15]
MSVGNEDGDQVVSHTTRLFIDGPMRRVLDIAAAVRDSGETLSLDEELRRFIRTTRMTGVTDWVCPIATVAALLDHVAGLCTDGMEALPQEFRRQLERAGGGTEASAYLHSLAGKLRALEQDPQDDYDELPLARWEIEVGFPRLSGFGANWVYDGEYATLHDSIQAAIDSEHPYCGGFLAPLAAEAQSALVLFPGKRAMEDSLSAVIGWVSPEALRHLLQAVDDHMRREHTVLS